MTSTAVPASSRVELDLGALFKRSWELFAAKPIEHILAAAITIVLGGITFGVLFGPLVVGYIRMVERQRRGEPIFVAQLFEFGGSFWSALGASILMAIGITIGFLLLLLPGLLLLFAWSYAFWFIAVDHATAVDSLGRSWRLAKQNFGSVALVWVVLIVLSFFGSAALIGHLITFPLGTLFATLAFSELRR